ncbi:CPBP family intramembrane glutamic endopeptidase [Dethiothermospora halolimnae]|uniref:CPBP family intramembrane glutamic endopeptidase n=1 Tax=Dethiothermospora halolimnae TaxID=3114390 RepID=UPI003CCBCF06
MLHILIAKGIKLKKKEINKGLIYTSLLIYLLELPSEEFVYRGIVFISLIKLFNPVVAIVLTSLLFLAIHIKTWDKKFVWIGSLVLALICATSVYLTKSIWTAIIIHNLNDFGFLTLVNSRNIFNR